MAHKKTIGKIFLDDENYQAWTGKSICEDFGKNEDGQDWDWVEVKDIAGGKISLVAIVTFPSCKKNKRGKRRIETLPTATFGVLLQEIALFSSFYDEKFNLVVGPEYLHR